MEKWLGENMPKLGFGLMRLPTIGEAKEIDFSTINEMVDAFLAAGFTYFDTAFGYMGGRNEETAKRVLVDRHPRDSFQLATKMPPWELKSEDDLERVFSTQLARTGAGYFDYYLLHSIGSRQLEAVDTFDAWGFIKEKKAQGLVRHIGFSFHDNADLLDEQLTKHPEIEFVQLQINYIDWEDGNIQSRRCYETARRHGVPVIIMEPVKGGALATLPDEARAVMKAARPEASPASWAMRYCGSLDGIITILSGMSTKEQMQDNINTMRSFEPLTDADRTVIQQVKDVLAAIPTIPCTDCRYCVEKCPKDIAIPGILRVENRRRTFGFTDKGGYNFTTNNHGKASACIACGVCEARCPQHIQIVELLKEAAGVFEE